MKVTVKGAAAVDPESELEDSHHVLETGGVIWNAVLNMVDITKGTNSYYKLQVLESDGGILKRYCVFRSWGRVGTTIGGTKLEVRVHSWWASSVVTVHDHIIIMYHEFCLQNFYTRKFHVTILYITDKFCKMRNFNANFFVVL